MCGVTQFDGGVDLLLGADLFQKAGSNGRPNPNLKLSYKCRVSRHLNAKS